MYCQIVSFLKAALKKYKRGKNCFWSLVQNIQIHNTHYTYSAYIGLHIYRSTIRCLHSPLQTNLYKLTQRYYWLTVNLLPIIMPKHRLSITVLRTFIQNRTGSWVIPSLYMYLSYLYSAYLQTHYRKLRIVLNY